MYSDGRVAAAAVGPDDARFDPPTLGLYGTSRPGTGSLATGLWVVGGLSESMLGHEAAPVLDDPTTADATRDEPASPVGDEFRLAATVRLDRVSSFLTSALTDAPAAAVELEYAADGWTFVSVTADDPDTFERALRTDATIESVERVSDETERRVYRVRGDLSAPVETDLDAGVFVEMCTLDCDGWHLRVRLAQRDALTGFVGDCRDAGFSPEVRRLAEVSGDAVPGTGMSGPQAALLSEAYDRGYFDVPRSISQAELAEGMDISSSGVSKRLRRATETLVASAVDTTSGRRSGV